MSILRENPEEAFARARRQIAESKKPRRSIVGDAEREYAKQGATVLTDPGGGNVATYGSGKAKAKATTKSKRLINAVALDPTVPSPVHDRLRATPGTLERNMQALDRAFLTNNEYWRNRDKIKYRLQATAKTVAKAGQSEILTDEAKNIAYTMLGQEKNVRPLRRGDADPIVPDGNTISDVVGRLSAEDQTLVPGQRTDPLNRAIQIFTSMQPDYRESLGSRVGPFARGAASNFTPAVVGNALAIPDILTTGIMGVLAPQPIDPAASTMAGKAVSTKPDVMTQLTGKEGEERTQNLLELAGGLASGLVMGKVAPGLKARGKALLFGEEAVPTRLGTTKPTSIPGEGVDTPSNPVTIVQDGATRTRKTEAPKTEQPKALTARPPKVEKPADIAPDPTPPVAPARPAFIPEVNGKVTTPDGRTGTVKIVRKRKGSSDPSSADVEFEDGSTGTHPVKDLSPVEAPTPEIATPKVEPPVAQSPKATGTDRRTTPMQFKNAQDTVGGVAVGSTTAFHPDGGSAHNFELRIVDLDDLRTSHDGNDFTPRSDYDPNLQPRERGDSDLQQQVQQITNQLDPAQIITDFRSTDRGAPITGPDGQVEAGNGRVMALQRARSQNPTRWQQYVDALKAEHPQAEGIANPVLVRVGVDDLDGPGRVDFAKRANRKSTASNTTTAEAFEAAGELTDDVIDGLQPIGRDVSQAVVAATNQKVVGRWLATLDPAEARVLTNDRTKLASRLGNAIVARLLGAEGRSVVSRVIQANEGFKTVLDAIKRTGVDLVKTQRMAELGEIPAEVAPRTLINEAIRLMDERRSKGQSHEDFFNQGRLDGSDQTASFDLARYMDENIRSPKRMENVLAEIAEAASKATDGGLFDDAPKVDLREMVRSAIDRANAPDDLFDGMGGNFQRGATNIETLMLMAGVTSAAAAIAWAMSPQGQKVLGGERARRVLLGLIGAGVATAAFIGKKPSAMAMTKLEGFIDTLWQRADAGETLNPARIRSESLDAGLNPTTARMASDAAHYINEAKRFGAESYLEVPRTEAAVNAARFMNGSAVRNPDGTVKTLYHGTAGDFEAFDTNRKATNGRMFGPGVYLTDSESVATGYAGASAGKSGGEPNVMPLLTNAEAPLDLNDNASVNTLMRRKNFRPVRGAYGADTTNPTRFGQRQLMEVGDKSGTFDTPSESVHAGARVAYETGFDALRHDGGSHAGNIFHEVVIVPDPTQVKNVAQNSGRFDPRDPRLRGSTDLKALALAAGAIGAVGTAALVAPSFRDWMGSWWDGTSLEEKGTVAGATILLGTLLYKGAKGNLSVGSNPRGFDIAALIKDPRAIADAARGADGAEGAFGEALTQILDIRAEHAFESQQSLGKVDAVGRDLWGRKWVSNGEFKEWDTNRITDLLEDNLDQGKSIFEGVPASWQRFIQANLAEADKVLGKFEDRGGRVIVTNDGTQSSKIQPGAALKAQGGVYVTYDQAVPGPGGERLRVFLEDGSVAYIEPGQKFGRPVNRIGEGFVPRVPKAEFIQQAMDRTAQPPEWQQAFADMLERSNRHLGLSRDELLGRIDDMANNGVQDVRSYLANLERERTLRFRAFAYTDANGETVRVAPYIDSYTESFSRYLDAANVRTAIAGQVGADPEALGTVIQYVAKLDPKYGEYLTKTVGKVLNLQPYRGKPGIGEAIAMGESAYESLSKLTTGTTHISQLNDAVYTLTTAGLAKTTKASYDLLFAPNKSDLRIQADAMAGAHQSWVNELRDQTPEGAKRRSLRQVATEEGRAAAASALAQRVLAGIALSSVDRTMKRVAAISNLRRAQQVLQKAADLRRAGKDVPDVMMRELDRFGLGERIDAAVSSNAVVATEGNGETMAQLSARIRRNNVYSGAVEDNPLWMSTPVGSMAMRFKRPQVMSTRFLTEFALTEFSKGNPKPILKLAAYGLAVGTVSKYLKDLIQGQGVDEETRRLWSAGKYEQVAARVFGIPLKNSLPSKVIDAFSNSVTDEKKSRVLMEVLGVSGQSLYDAGVTGVFGESTPQFNRRLRDLAGNNAPDPYKAAQPVILADTTQVAKRLWDGYKKAGTYRGRVSTPVPNPFLTQTGNEFASMAISAGWYEAVAGTVPLVRRGAMILGAEPDMVKVNALERKRRAGKLTPREEADLLILKNKTVGRFEEIAQTVEDLKGEDDKKSEMIRDILGINADGTMRD